MVEGARHILVFTCRSAGGGTDRTDDACKLFKDLAIMGQGENYLKHMAQYPVIQISLKAAKQPDFNQAFYALKESIAEEFRRHQWILDRGCLDVSFYPFFI